MKTTQPSWKIVSNMGDRNPIDHGGYFVYVDETGTYDPEAELLVTYGENVGNQWTVFRFSLERCTCLNGILSDNKYHPDYPAWFAKDLTSVAETHGQALDELVLMLCSEDPKERARAYESIGNYHGFENFDSYPLTFTDRAEVEARYAEDLAALKNS